MFMTIVPSSLLRFSTLALPLLTLLFLLNGCDLMELSNEPDPNNPSLEDIIENPTPEKLANVAVGVEAGMRVDLNLYLTDVSMIGREVYRFSASDPRFTADLLGRGSSVLDNNTFYITRPWAERYRVVRNAEIMIEALDNSGDAFFNDAQKAGFEGYAQTIIAYQLLLNANLTFENGIRIDVSADEVGPVVGYDEALTNIAERLDTGFSRLQAASETFEFPLSEGFDGFDTPAEFTAFNRALAARVAVYRGNYSQALDLLADSFVDEEAALTNGIYHVFSTAPGDLVNPWFLPPQESGNLLAAHPSYVDDIARNAEGEIIDDRFSKVVEREEAFAADGLSSNWGFFVYKTQEDPIPIVRNAELLLIRAEANIWEGNFGDAIDDLNVIRTAAGLSEYDGPETQEALLDEMLTQRRYELYGEGHRWVDVRRYERLDTLPIDREEDTVWAQFPIPASENL